MKSESRCTELDNDLCVEMAGGNRFNLVIMAAARAREIRRQNMGSDKFEHLHTPVSALLDFQTGKVGPEYIKRVR